MANAELEVSSLSFDTIKDNLKTFMQSQDTFADYEFDGSAISVLLDVLAYNTYYNNIYLNHVATEMFLDSAQLTDSVYSIAKSLNYLPRSYQSSVAYVNLDINPTTSPASVTVPKYTQFTSTVDGVTYTFSTNTTYVAYANTGYVLENVPIYEGNIVDEVYSVTTGERVFYINNFDVDTSSITVKIRASATDSTNSEYTRANTLFGLTSTSNVFFVEAASNGSYNVVFGNGTFGRKPVNGNLIEVSYRVSTASSPNGANSFSSTGIGGHATTVQLVTRASGGTTAETLDNIRFAAPRALATQERAVTKEDYKTLVQNEFPQVTSMNVFGGEELVPPKFGHVVVACRSNSFDILPSSVKREIVNFVKNKSPIGVTTEVLDPEFNNIVINCSVSFDKNSTSKSAGQIEQIVRDVINTFNTDNLDKFDTTFRKSKLIQKINDGDASILSNDVDVRLTKTIAPTVNVRFNAALEFNNELKVDNPIDSVTQDQYVTYATPAVESTTFTYTQIAGASLRDDGNGKLMVVTANTTDLTILNNDVGTISYEDGEVVVSNLVINAYSAGTTSIKVYVRPKFGDVVADNLDVIRIRPEDTTITVKQELL